jgi:RNA polymerase-associated protein LEO1
MYLLKVPAFMSIEPEPWQVTTFQPPKTDHHSRKPASATFSAFNTAMTTVRWRHSPLDHSVLQSNARINRWSDGSLTVQLASDPNTQYEIDGNSLAPPQRNPVKPTPVSMTTGRPGGRPGQAADDRYDHRKDAFTYLVAPVESAEALRVTHQITAGLSIKQPENAEDDAIERLQAALASAANATKVAGASGQLEVTEVDPEEQRRLAEAAERQAMRDRKKRENAQERERLRTDRALGRAGVSSNRYGGLNVGMLEDDETEGPRGRATGGKPRAKARKRPNSEYSEDEDYGNKRFTNREDDYDQEDDFVAPSDEEELVEDDDDPDDGIVEAPRERSPKRDRPRPAGGDAGRLGDDEDAEGEIDEDGPQARTKRRRVVEDEDEE